MMEKNIKDLAKKDRPRERLIANGAGFLSDEELLIIILGRGVRGNSVTKIAKQLAKYLDNSYEAVDDTVKIDAIKKIKGVGEAKATTIMAALEYVRRRVKPEGIKITSPTDIVPLICHHGDKKQEMFFCIMLNGANEVIKVQIITIGLVNRTQVHPREVFADAIAKRASSIIVAHNHPSGNLTPSTADIDVTKRIKEAGKILGIQLLDHIIFSRKKHSIRDKNVSLFDHYSLAENGEL